VKRAIAILAMLAGAAFGQWDASPILSVLGGARTWTPADLGSKLAIWYDASDGATVLDAGGTPCTNGASVQTWQDKSGNSRHASATASAQRPAYYTAVQNGRAVVRATGASLMQATNAGAVFRNKTAGYIVAVARTPSHSTGDGTHPFVVATTPSGLPTRLGCFSRGAAGNVWSAGARRLDADSFTYAALGANTNAILVEARGDWGAGYVRGATNGAALASTALPSGAGASQDTDGAGVALFSLPSPTYAPSGAEIAEAVIVNAAMSDAELSSLRAYLRTKWGTP
jgi:hypothetical protein